MSYFNVNRFNYDISVADLKTVVEKELGGPGNLLGYRALYLNLRQHDLNVPRDLVDVNQEGLRNRQPALKKKNEKGNFVSMGSNWVILIDGHDLTHGISKYNVPSITIWRNRYCQ